MWINRKEWQALLDRVEILEKNTRMGKTQSFSSEGELIFASPYSTDVQIASVVEALARHCGLHYYSGTAPSFKVKKDDNLSR